MPTITINELHKALTQAKKDGLGKKKILISNDDEGRGYHELLFFLTPTEKIFTKSKFPPSLPFGVSTGEVLEDYIILG